ncbi:hypothetical protein E4U21_007893 [Claviceps maximensis]|nr:hypothetical protein E4U21_007893 [Claviceps maximensis]
METITNIAQSAVKAVWGSSAEKKEPISGAEGDVAKGEPFDAGNLESKTSDASTTGDAKPAAEPASDIKESKDNSKSNAVAGEVTKQQAAGVSNIKEPSLAKTLPPVSSTTKDIKSNSNDNAVVNKQKVTAVPQPIEPSAAKSQSSVSGNTKDIKPTSNNAFVSKQKVTEVPQTTEPSTAKALPLRSSNVKDSKDKSNDIPVAGQVNKPQVTGAPSANEPAPAKSQPSRSSDTNDKSNKDPVVGNHGEKQVKGESPRPLATVAKEHGGDAGNAHTESKTKSNNPASSKNADDKASKEKGTGEKYVKTTGVAADGGDFDAIKPGAGKEADRLMDVKGIQRETGDSSKPLKGAHVEGVSGSDGSSQKSQEKPSIKERVKDKLHLHKD